MSARCGAQLLFNIWGCVGRQVASAGKTSDCSALQCHRHTMAFTQCLAYCQCCCRHGIYSMPCLLSMLLSTWHLLKALPAVNATVNMAFTQGLAFCQCYCQHVLPLLTWLHSCFPLQTCRGTGVQVHVRPLGPGMVQQIQARCSSCNGTGQGTPASEWLLC